MTHQRQIVYQTLILDCSVQELTANSLSNTHPSPLSPQGVAAEPHQTAVAAVVRVLPLECPAGLVDSCHACGASEGEAVSNTAGSERLGHGL